MKKLIILIVLGLSFSSGKAQTDSVPSTDSTGSIGGTSAYTDPPFDSVSFTPVAGSAVSPGDTVPVSTVTFSNEPDGYDYAEADAAILDSSTGNSTSGRSHAISDVMTEESIKFSFTVYPNPSDGSDLKIAVNADEGKEILMVVYDALGREQFSKLLVTENNGDTTFAIDPSGTLASGIYIITATSQKNSCSKRLIVK